MAWPTVPFSCQNGLWMPAAWARKFLLLLCLQRQFWPWCRSQYNVRNTGSLQGATLLWKVGMLLLLWRWTDCASWPQGREYTWDSAVYCKGHSQRGSSLCLSQLRDNRCAGYLVCRYRGQKIWTTLHQLLHTYSYPKPAKHLMEM